MSEAAHPLLSRSILRGKAIVRHNQQRRRLGDDPDPDVCAVIHCVGPADSCTDYDDLYNSSSTELFICSGQQNCVGQQEWTSNGTCADPYELGMPCNYDADCATRNYLADGDAYCDRTSKICVLKKQDGEACSISEECEPPLNCRAKTGLCTDVRVGAEGASCEDDDDDACLPGLECFNNACTRYRELSEACDDFDGVSCRLGLSCVNNICTPLQSGKLGDSCSISIDCNPGLVCSQDLVCSAPSTTPGRVVPDCDTADCDAASFCDCDHDDGQNWCTPLEPVSDDLIWLYWQYTRCMHENDYDEYLCAVELEKYIWADPDVDVDTADYCLGV